MESRNNKLTDPENRSVVVRSRVNRWVRWMKGVKRYRLPFIKQIRYGDVNSSIVTIYNIYSVINYSRHVKH